MTQQLQGKVALVTGGSRGIGAAIAKRLAANGAHVAFSYAKSAEQAQQIVNDIERHGVQAMAIQADQGDTAQVTALVKQVHQHFGRLDILVNSAGMFVTGTVDATNADIAAFDRQQAVNVGGVVTAVRTAVGLMSDGGRIISLGRWAPQAPIMCPSPAPPITSRPRLPSPRTAVVGHVTWARAISP